MKEIIDTIYKGLMTQDSFNKLTPKTKNHPSVIIAAIEKKLILQDSFNALYKDIKNTPSVVNTAIYNKHGSASGGHYEAPLHLHQLLFNS